MAQAPVQKPNQAVPQNQPTSAPATPVPIGTGQPPKPTSSPPTSQAQSPVPSGTGPKLSPPLLLALVAVIVVALGVFLTVNSKIFQKIKPTLTPSPIEDHSKPPSENIFGVNGRIVSIDEKEKIFEVTTTTPNWDKHWMVKVGKDTILATFSDWTSPKYAAKGPLTTMDQLVKTVPRKQFSDYKVGDTVYLMAKEGQDYAKEMGVFEPFAIFLQ